MATEAKVVLDSISPNGVRLVTFEVTFWRAVLAEFNTHRVFSRNSASSRAIPVQKMLDRVTNDPFLPLYWGANQSGMQAAQELSAEDIAECKDIWLDARDSAMHHARRLLEKGLHKQTANRLLEPFLYHTVLVTATEYDNFFALRAHPDAQPEIKVAAEAMLKALQESTPQPVGYGQWHLPLVPDVEQLRSEGYNTYEIVRISAGRCARVSYLTHHGTREPQADIDLCNRLIGSGHMSPMEHPATPFVDDEFLGNIRGWRQFRKTITNEQNFGAVVR